MDQKKLMDKINDFKEGDLVDLSSKEDLAIGIMNLVSLEEHFFFTYNKTGKNDYLKLLNEVRSLRKKYLAEIVKDPEGEVWCISKHLLASSMRFMEVGTKKLGEGDKEKAQSLFKDSYNLWNLFWGLNLDLLDVKDIKAKEKVLDEVKEEKKKSADLEVNPFVKKEDEDSLFGKLGKVVGKILDCCRE